MCERCLALLTSQVAGSPELYTILVDSGIVLNLLACTLHDNTDVAADVIELFMELTSAGEQALG